MFFLVGGEVLSTEGGEEAHRYSLSLLSYVIIGVSAFSTLTD